MSTLTRGRFYQFERCFNFRDLGGYETEDGRVVRLGRLYRSMTPEYMTDEDVQAALHLGLRLVIDLRGSHFKSSGPLGEGPARRLAVGLRRRHPRTLEQLRGFIDAPPEEALPRVLDVWAGTFAKALAAAADEEGPVLVHCRLGKDRTGVFSALVLKLLGVPDETIIDDYMLSEQELPGAHGLMEELGEQNAPLEESLVASSPPSREGMTRTLRRIENEFGGARSYFRQHRVSGKKLDAFATSMLSSNA